MKIMLLYVFLALSKITLMIYTSMVWQSCCILEKLVDIETNSLFF